jgi:hypothetical protein
MAGYGLARHIFVCRDGEHIVVLDLRQDRYFALEAARTSALTAAVPGWPAPVPDSAPPEAAIQQAATALVRRGWLLERSAGDWKDATPASIQIPEAELADSVTSADEVRIGLGTVSAFVLSAVFAKFALRFWSLERVVRRVAARRARNAVREAGGAALDVERARQLMTAFERMRVFLFSKRQECLHDSLTVLEFLAWYGQFPSWVFGVRARPFEAHCWVQHGATVFNDTVEHVGAYIPIMVV